MLLTPLSHSVGVGGRGVGSGTTGDVEAQRVLLQRQLAVKELRLLTRQMMQKARQTRAAPRRDSLYRGSVAQLTVNATPGRQANQVSAIASAMHNHHGMNPRFGTSDNAPNGLVDRCASDSLMDSTSDKPLMRHQSQRRMQLGDQPEQHYQRLLKRQQRCQYQNLNNRVAQHSATYPFVHGQPQYKCKHQYQQLQYQCQYRHQPQRRYQQQQQMHWHDQNQILKYRQHSIENYETQSQKQDLDGFRNQMEQLQDRDSSLTASLLSEENQLIIPKQLVLDGLAQQQESIEDERSLHQSTPPGSDAHNPQCFSLTDVCANTTVLSDVKEGSSHENALSEASSDSEDSILIRPTAKDTKVGSRQSPCHQTTWPHMDDESFIDTRKFNPTIESYCRSCDRSFSVSDEEDEAESKYPDAGLQQHSSQSANAIVLDKFSSEVSEPYVEQMPCLTINRPLVAASLATDTEEPSRAMVMVLSGPSSGNAELVPSSPSLAESLSQQLNNIEQRMADPGGQQMLCTSSSNCCGIRRSGKRNGQSLSRGSSLNLAAGAKVLCRPGSFRGINIDGLKSRNLRCVHEAAVRSGEPMELLTIQRMTCIRSSRSSKKRVSFSACANRQEKSDIFSSSFGTNLTSTQPQPNCSKVNLEYANTDTDISEIESDSKDIVSFRRASQRGRMPPVGSVDWEKGTFSVSQYFEPRTADKGPAEARDGAEGSTGYPEAPPAVTMSNDETESIIALAIGKGIDTQTSEMEANMFDKVVENKAEESEANSQKLRAETPVTDRAIAKRILVSESNSAGAVHQSKNNLDFRSGTVKIFVRTRQQQQQPRLQQPQQKQQRKLCQLYDNSGTNSPNEFGAKKIRGSNCANSFFGNYGNHRPHSARCHNHFAAAKDALSESQYSATSETSTGSSSALHKTVISPMVGRSSSQGVVCQRPTTLARSQTGRPGDSEDSSIAFSWTTALEKDSSCFDLSVSVNGCQTTSHHNNTTGFQSAGGRSGYKVRLNKMSPQEDSLTSIKACEPLSERLAAVNCRDTCVRPSAVKGTFATISSLAKQVVCTASAEHICTYDSSEFSEDSTSRPILMLEAVSCGHDNRDNCKISCRSSGFLTPQQSQTMPTAKAPHRSQQSHPGALPKPMPRHHVPANQQKPPAAAAVATPKAASCPASSTVQDLMAGVCNPAEATAMTGALVRGLVCNVKSLQSALSAALLLLKDQRGSTGHLAQALGTANTLDELIRRVQVDQQVRPRRRSRSRSGDRSLSPYSSSEVEQTASVKSRWSQASRTATSSVQCCHAMSHYVIGEQMVEPTLDLQPSLECRPATTRVVRTECNTVHLAGDGRSGRGC